MDARTLLALRPGTRLRVALRGGRKVEVELCGNPWVECSGAPGVGRVKMRVLDVETEARLAAAFERRDRYAPRPGFERLTRARVTHDVSGTQILEVL